MSQQVRRRFSGQGAETPPITHSALAKRPRLESATYTLGEFAALLGISYSAAHAAAQSGSLPVVPIRHGVKYLFPKAKVHALLGLPLDAEPKEVGAA